MEILPVLNYHGIEERRGEYPWADVETPYVISSDMFLRHLDFLVSNQFVSLAADQLKEWFGGRFPNGRSIILTFDDGHISHYQYAVPALKQKKLNAIFFIPVALVGQTNQMSWAQLKELAQAGFEIGSHGYSHDALSGMTHHGLWRELERSKKMLEDRLGIRVRSFSVPKGYYQLRIREVAMELGYDFLFTSRFDVNLSHQDPWRLSRLAIKKKTSFQEFSNVIYGRLGYKRIIEQAKEAARRFLNPSIYDALADWKQQVTHD